MQVGAFLNEQGVDNTGIQIYQRKLTPTQNNMVNVKPRNERPRTPDRFHPYRKTKFEKACYVVAVENTADQA